MIKAIPTLYNGITYRSRTEAKWALFFDKEDIPFHYEAEGFQTEAGWYLPDFRFMAARQPIHFEVKPAQPTEGEYALLHALASGAKVHVFVAHGAPHGECIVEKIYAADWRERWWFALEHEGSCGYLTTELYGGGKDLPIKRVHNPLGAYGFGPEASLNAAGRAHFDHDPGRGGAFLQTAQRRVVKSDSHAARRRVIVHGRSRQD